MSSISSRLKTTIRQRFFSSVSGDLTGGLVAAIVALPLALAFGEVSGLGAAAGLYGAIACGIFASMFGATPVQVSGPTGPMTVVAAGVVATAIANNHNPSIVFSAVILAGIFQILLGIFRGGQYIHYIPYPVISGFLSGIGVIIISLQLLPLLGLKGASKPIEALQALPEAIQHVNMDALLLGVLSLIVIYTLPRLTKAIPATLVALIIGSITAYLLGMDVPRIEGIPSGLPDLHLPWIQAAELGIVLKAALVLALLGSIDSLLTSVMLDRLLGIRHNSNQELVGQGIGNTMAGLIGGLPGASATMRTMVNLRSGGRGYLGGIIHGIVLILIMAFFGPLVEQIPMACLAGVLISVGFAIMDYRGLTSIMRSPKSDTAVMLTVLLLTVFADLITAVGVGMALASILFMKKLSDVQFSQHGGLKLWIDKWYQGSTDVVSPEVMQKTYVYQFNGPLFFGEVKNFNNVLPEMYTYPYVILHFASVSMTDQTGAYALEDSIRGISEHGGKVYLVNIPHSVRQTLERFGVFEHLQLEQENILTFSEALADIAKTEAERQAAIEPIVVENYSEQPT